MNACRYIFRNAVLIGLAHFAFSTGAQADFYKAGDLKLALKSCQVAAHLLRPKDIISCSKGIGYVAGIADGANNSVVCLDDKVKAATLAGYFVAYSDNFPEIAHKEAKISILKAIEIKFPCKKS